MRMVCEITRESVKQNQVYLWVANKPDYTTRVVRLSGCGDYLVENGDFELEYWNLDDRLTGSLYEIDVDIEANELISEDESKDY